MAVFLPRVEQGETRRAVPAEVPLGFSLEPGRILELVGSPGSGLTRLGLSLLAGPSRILPVVALDVRGWLSPAAAWETGVVREHLVVVRCADRRAWLRVTAALCEGVQAIYAEVPAGIGDQDLRRLAALARARGVRMALHPLGARLPAGVAHVRLRGTEVWWEGLDRGHGRLAGRRLVLEASGKGMAGIVRRVELEDDGAGGLRVVPGLAAGAGGRAVG